MHPALLNLTLALLPVTTPTGEPAQAHISNDLFAIYSAGLDEVLKDPRDGGVRALLANLQPMLEAMGESNGEPVPMPAMMIARWINQPMCLVGNVSPEGTPSFQFDISWDERADARKEFSQLRKILKKEGVSLSASDADAGSMTVETPAGKFSAKLIDLDKGAILSINLGRDRTPAFQLPSYSLPVGIAPVFIANWSGKAMAEILDAHLTDEDQKLVAKLLDTVGLAGPNAMDISVSLGHGGAESISTTHVKGWSDSFFGKHMTGRLDESDLALLPADTLWGWVGNMKVSSLFDLAREINKPEVDKALQMATAMVGLDLEQDLFGRIGPVMGAYSSRGTGGAGGPTGLVFFAECDQPEMVMQSIEKLLKLAEAQTQLKISSSKWMHGDIACTTFSSPGTAMPVEPCVGISGDRLFIAASRNALIEALEQTMREESILSHPRVASLPPAALKDLLSFNFFDADFGLERGYASIGMLQSMASNMLAGAQADVDLSALPNLSSIMPSYVQLASGSRPTVSLTYVRGGDLLQATTHDSSMVARVTALTGSPMSFGGPAAMGMVASVAIPKLMSARLSANENAAISTMRMIVSAQSQIRSSVACDGDRDGKGEYGMLGELTGSRSIRDTDFHIPPILSPTMGELIVDGCDGTLVQRSGYYIQIFVPGSNGGMVSDHPVAGDTSAGRIDSDAAESRWCAYAWPVDAGSTGNRSFFVDHRGSVYFSTPGGFGSYSGLCSDEGSQPSFNAAYSHGSDTHMPSYGEVSSDGNVWQMLN